MIYNDDGKFAFEDLKLKDGKFDLQPMEENLALKNYNC